MEVIGQAVAQYAIKFVIFAVVILLGIFVGKKLREKKDNKDIQKVNMVKEDEWKGNEQTNE